MKIKDEFALREIAGQGIVVATGKRALSFNGMIRLNEVSILIWKMLETGVDKQQIAEKVTSVYNVEERVAAADIDALVSKLIAADVVEE